jgi:hypothetical protein
MEQRAEGSNFGLRIANFEFSKEDENLCNSTVSTCDNPKICNLQSAICNLKSKI